MEILQFATPWTTTLQFAPPISADGPGRALLTAVAPAHPFALPSLL